MIPRRLATELVDWELSVTPSRTHVVPGSVMLENELSALDTRAAQLPWRRQNFVMMYTEGLKQRLIQIKFCLAQLQQLDERTWLKTADSSTSVLDLDEMAQFFCDTFWTWVYSSADILAQIINQTENLGLDEGDVSFHAVLTPLRQQQARSGLWDSVDRLERSWVRSWMKTYRNCANHRRPICLIHESRKLTPGYRTKQDSSITTTGPIQPAVQRFICDHSVALTPNIGKKIKLRERCETASRMLNERIEAVVKTMLPL